MAFLRSNVGAGGKLTQRKDRPREPGPHKRTVDKETLRVAPAHRPAAFLWNAALSGVGAVRPFSQRRS